MNNLTAHNSTDYYLLNTKEGIWGMIPTTTVNVFMVLLAILMYLGHRAYVLPARLLKKCMRMQTESNPKASLQFLCMSMVAFSILRVLFSVTKGVSYILSYKNNGTEAFRAAIDLFYGISIFTFAIGVGMYLALISQVIHIWLIVVKSLDCDQRFGPWFFRVMDIILVIISLCGIIVIIPGGIVLAIPYRILTREQRLAPIILFTGLFGVLMVSLTLIALGVGSYIILIVYKSHIKHKSTKKLTVIFRMAAFIVLFIICAYIQIIGLVVATRLSPYYSFLLIQSCPEIVVVLFMCITFWPFKMGSLGKLCGCCVRSVQRSDEVPTESTKDSQQPMQQMQVQQSVVETL